MNGLANDIDNWLRGEEANRQGTRIDLEGRARVSARLSLPRLGSGRSDRRIEMHVANAVLTTAVDARGQSWTS
jgi:hypothetical protein